MKLRPKTVRRLTLLTVVLVIFGSLGVGALSLRKWQRGRTITALRFQGMEFYQSGNFDDALPLLARYVRQNKDDPKALLALAEVRRAIETGNGSHLAECASVLRAYRLLEPEPLEPAMELLELYMILGSLPEADALATELLERDNLPLQNRVTALLSGAAAQRQMNPVATIADRYVQQAAEMAPENFEAQRRYTGILLRADPDAACEHATDLLKQHDDPRFAVLKALACDRELAQDRPPSAETVRTVEKILTDADDDAFEDASFVAAVLTIAAQTRDSALALAVLRRAAALPTEEDTFWPVLYVRTLYELDRFADAAAQAERLLPSASPRYAADLEAYAVLALRLASGDDAQSIDELTGLADRLLSIKGGSFRSQGWSHALKGVAALDDGEPLAAEAALSIAVESYPAEPTIRMLHGDALARLHRAEEAQEEWKTARNLVNGVWLAAELRVVRSLITSGQTRAALDAATDAIRGSPNRIGVYLGWLNAYGVQMQSGLATSQERKMARDIIDSLDNALSSADPAFLTAVERTLLPIRIALAFASDPEADLTPILDRPTAESALDNAEVFSQVSTQLVLAGRELPSSFQARAENKSPDKRLQFARALRADEAGDPDAIRFLRTPPDAEDWQWAILRAQLTERAAASLPAEREAAQQWSALFQANPTNLEVIDAVLGSSTAPYAPDLIDKAATALAIKTGSVGASPPASVLLARAQAVYLGTPTLSQRDAAIASLEQLVNRAPTNLPAHVTLAGLYLMQDREHNIEPSPARAAEHLLTASEMIGGSAADMFRLQGASLFQITRDFDSARDALFRMLDRADAAGPDLLWNAGRLLLAQGEPDLAIRLFDRAQQTIAGELKPSLLVDRARASEGMANDTAASNAYQQAVMLGLRQPGEALAAANFFARTNQEEWRTRALDALDAMELAPGIAELTRARHADRMAELDEAAQWYQQALQRDPDRPDAWADLGRLRIRAGDFEAADTAINSGLKHYPDDVPLRILQRQVQADLNSGGAIIDLNALSDIYDKRDSTARIAEAMRAIAALQDIDRLGDRDALVKLAQQFPDVLPVQTLVGRLLIGSDIGANDEAAELMMRATEYFPAEAEPARLATVAYSIAGDFEQMQVAALLWRRRDPTSARSADVAIAESAMELNQRTRATAIIDTYLDLALANPSNGLNLRVLQIWIRLSAPQGQLPQVKTRLTPLLDGPDSEAILTSVWLPAIADTIPDWPTASQWLEIAEQHADSPTLVAVLVDACRFRAERKLPDPEQAMSKAVAMGESLRNSTDPFIQTTLADLDRFRAQRLREEGRSGEAESMAQGAIAQFQAASEGAAPASRCERLIRAAGVAEWLPDLDLAAAIYQSAIEETGAPVQMLATAHNNLAFVLHQRGQPGDANEATRHIDLALQISRRPAFLHTKAKILVESDHVPEAIDTLRESLRLDATHAPSLAALAVLMAEGDETARREAAQLLERAKDAPGSPSASTQADLERARHALDL